MSVLEWFLAYFAVGLISFLILTADDRRRNILPEDDMNSFFFGIAMCLTIWPICLIGLFVEGVLPYLMAERKFKK